MLEDLLERKEEIIVTYNKNCTRYFSERQEKRIAKSIGAKQTPNSGASWIKGDLISKCFNIECKTATQEKQTFSVPKKWLKAMPEETFSNGKQYWALAFDYGDGDEYYIIDKKLFKRFKDFLEKEEDNYESEAKTNEPDDSN